MPSSTTAGSARGERGDRVHSSRNLLILSELDEDAVGVAQKLEVHRIAELGVAAEPVEAVTLERADPAAWQCRALVHRIGVTLASRVIGPRRDAAAAGVAIRIDVDRDAEEVVRDFTAAVAVGVSEAAERVRLILILLPLANLADALFDAAECRGDLFVDVDPEPHELHAERLRRCPFGVQRLEVEAFRLDASVVLDAVPNGSRVSGGREASLPDETRSLEKCLRFLEPAHAAAGASGCRVSDVRKGEAKRAENSGYNGCEGRQRAQGGHLSKAARVGKVGPGPHRQNETAAPPTNETATGSRSRGTPGKMA
jgi:hypothetical protein